MNKIKVAHYQTKILITLSALFLFSQLQAKTRMHDWESWFAELQKEATGQRVYNGFGDVGDTFYCYFRRGFSPIAALKEFDREATDSPCPCQASINTKVVPPIR